MLEDGRHGGPFVGAHPQNGLDEVDLGGGELLRKGHRLLHAGVQLLFGGALEGGLAADHLEEENAQGPDVHLLVLLKSEQHLGRHILQSAAPPPALPEQRRRAEVAQLRGLVPGQQDVLGLG